MGYFTGQIHYLARCFIKVWMKLYHFLENKGANKNKKTGNKGKNILFWVIMCNKYRNIYLNNDFVYFITEIVK